MARRATWAGIGLAAVATAGLAGSCDEAALVRPGDGEVVEVAFGRDRSDFPGSSWTLRSAGLEDDDLVLEVEHAGGCAVHGFRVVAVQGFLTLPTAGPLPSMAVPLAVVHDDRGDTCEALVVRTIRADLSPLREAYRDRGGVGAARVLLRVPTAHGSDRVRTLTWEI